MTLGSLSANGRSKSVFLVLLGAVLAGGPTFMAGRNQDLCQQVDEIHEQTHDLWVWHNVTDPATGAKIWYVQQSLQKAINGLSVSIDTQTNVMRQLCDEFKDLRREVRAPPS
jgi:hypothetical protein